MLRIYIRKNVVNNNILNVLMKKVVFVVYNGIVRVGGFVVRGIVVVVLSVGGWFGFWFI